MSSTVEGSAAGRGASADGAFAVPEAAGTTPRAALPDQDEHSTRPVAPSLREMLLVLVVALVGAVILYHRRWSDIHGNYLSDGGVDSTIIEWYFGVVADKVTHVHSLMSSDLQNMPVGINLMANVSMLGLTIPLIPVTLTFGPAVSTLVVMTCGLAVTTAAWFWLFRRWLVPDAALSAGVGAFVCGFGPGMIAHANGPHPFLVVGVLIPVILDRLLLLAQGRRAVRDGVVLGILTAYQVFVGEELLFLTLIGAALFTVGYLTVDPARVRSSTRPLLTGMGLGGVIAAVVVAYPLHYQFTGPGHYQGLFWTPSAPARSFVEYPGRSLGGDPTRAGRLADAEQNAFFGWPLVVVGACLAVLMWRKAAARGAAVMTLGAAVLALGRDIPLPGTAKSLPGPYRLVDGRPLFDSLLETRLALICLPGFAVLICLALVRTRTMPRAGARYLAAAVVGGALLPLVPTPCATTEWPATPAFITSGEWTRYVRPGHTLLTAPLPSASFIYPLHWQMQENFGFSLAGGHFNAPSYVNGVGVYGAAPRPTSDLFNRIVDTDQAVAVDDAMVVAAKDDLAYWQADAVVVPPGRAAPALRATVEALLGRPPDTVGGVFVWRLWSAPPA